MSRGEQKKTYLSVEEILKSTSGGYDIFRTYLGTVSKLMKRPWPGPKGTRDNHASWGVYPREGIWFFKDKATEEAGTAIQFVQKYFSLNLNEAKDKICWDFGLGGGKEMNANPVQIVWEKPEVEDKEYVHITFESQPFKKEHHKFWNAAGVSEEHCKKYNCFAVKSLAIKRAFIPLKKDEPVFAYYAPEEDSVKIYFPERPDMKFRNNVPGDYLWNYNNVRECDKLIIQKSMKDLIVTTLINPCCIATQNESAGIFEGEMLEKIVTLSKKPVVWYGADPDGVEKCTKITKANKWGYINTPKNLLPDVNDAYSYAKKFGLKRLEEFMKLKKLV